MDGSDEDILLFADAGGPLQHVSHSVPEYANQHSNPRSSQQAHQSGRSLLSEMRRAEGREPQLSMDQNSINLSHSNKYAKQMEEQKVAEKPITIIESNQI